MKIWKLFAKSFCWASWKVANAIYCDCIFCSFLEMEKKMKEERAAREKAENRIVQIEKQCSMLDFDLKQSQQKLEHLSEQKERLEEEVIRALLILLSWNFLLLSAVAFQLQRVLEEIDYRVPFSVWLKPSFGIEVELLDDLFCEDWMQEYRLALFSMRVLFQYSASLFSGGSPSLISVGLRLCCIVWNTFIFLVSLRKPYKALKTWLTVFV